MQALRRKVTVAELGQLSPLKSPPCFFQPANGYSSIFARPNTQTYKQIHRQHQRHRVSYLFSKAFDFLWCRIPTALQHLSPQARVNICKRSVCMRAWIQKDNASVNKRPIDDDVNCRLNMGELKVAISSCSSFKYWLFFFFSIWVSDNKKIHSSAAKQLIAAVFRYLSRAVVGLNAISKDYRSAHLAGLFQRRRQAHHNRHDLI